MAVYSENQANPVNFHFELSGDLQSVEGGGARSYHFSAKSKKKKKRKKKKIPSTRGEIA
jgi:hypothetical protein